MTTNARDIAPVGGFQDCPECEGQGWTVGVDVKPRCCGRSDYECGGRGCTGPEPEQIQVQEQCEYCCGSGVVEPSNEEIPPFADPTQEGQ